MALSTTSQARTRETDPVRGRELLARHMRLVVMTPSTAGGARSYLDSGAFNLAKCLPAVERKPA